MNKVSCAITDSNITVNFNNQTHIVSRTDALAETLLKALREGRNDEIPELVSAAKRVVKYGKGDFTVDNGCILVNGQPVHESLSRKILKFQAEGLPHKPLVRFAENLQKNPSYRAVTELFTFLDKNEHPITEDGNFIAYKRVRSDFKDIHSGTFDNSVGKVLEMPRNQVNEDSTQTCSHGLHVANWHYAHTQFASSNPSTDVMLEVEVNPADVVSIPVDYNNAKMRVCRYTVLGVVDKEHSSDDYLRTTSETSEPLYVDEEDDDFGDCLSCGVRLTEDDGYDYCEDCEVEDEYPYEDEIEKY